MPRPVCTPESCPLEQLRTKNTSNHAALYSEILPDGMGALEALAAVGLHAEAAELRALLSLAAEATAEVDNILDEQPPSYLERSIGCQGPTPDNDIKDPYHPDFMPLCGSPMGLIDPGAAV